MHPLSMKSRIIDLWEGAIQIRSTLETLLAQGRNHIEERHQWAQERESLQRTIRSQAATILVVVSRCKSLEKDLEQSMSLHGWRARGQNENRRAQ